MKIVYCIHSLSNSGGMERIVTEKANALAEMGHQITIVTAEQKAKKTFFSLYPTVSHYDLDVNYSANRGLITKLFQYPYKKYLHKKRLSNLLMKIRPDIAISTMGNEFLFLYKIKDGSKKIIEIHFAKEYRMKYKRGKLWRLIDIYRSKQEENKVSKYEKFVILTHEDKSSWRKVNNIVVIPNFITSIPLQQAKLDEKVCLAIGRLSYQKGFDRLIKAWRIVHESFPSWKLQIYGSGELHDSLLNLINELHLNQVISINPPISQIEIAYLNSSVFLLTSHYEGLPMVLLEALSYGIPVVSFACKCGPRDLISDGLNGFIVPDGDIRNFANKVILLLEDESLRKKMGLQAYQISLEYSKEKIMAKWIALFESIMTESSRRCDSLSDN